MSQSERPTLRPSSVGQFFRVQSCPQFLQWEYDDEGRAAIARRNWKTKQVSPVLANDGDTFEHSQVRALDDGSRELYGVEEENLDVTLGDTWPDDNETGRDRLLTIVERLETAPPSADDVVVFQPHFRGTIGEYELAGKGDLLVLESIAEGIRPTILEIKSASEQKVHHRYQATIYAELLTQFLEENGITFESAGDGAPRTCIVTPENQITSGPTDPASFSVAPYRAKLTLKLQAGGSFDQTILETDFESTTNRIARRCAGCQYEPLCVTRGVEAKGLELLGLQAGTQHELHELGIHTLEDFAMLFEHPEGGSVHWDYTRLEPRDEELVRQVRQEADISNLQKRAQIAYRFLLEIDDSYGADWPDWYPHPLRGTGNALPEDEHGQLDVDWEQFQGPDYPSGSLIRVYLYVQEDHAQDRVTLLSGTVECSLTDEQRFISELPEEIPTGQTAKHAEEDRLFTEFFEQLADAISAVSPVWSERPRFQDFGCNDDEGFLHLYLFSDSQRDALMEAARRHPEGRWRRPIRTLLGLREGIDQQMVSVLQADFRNRWAMRFPGLGIVQSVAHFRWDEEWFDWQRSRESGDTAAITSIFERGLFDSTVRYQAYQGHLAIDHSSPEPAWTEDDRQFKRRIYPVQHREAEQLPIEYIWGVHDRLDPDAADDPEVVEQYRYRSGTSGARIDDEDLRLASRSLALATRHVERTIEDTKRFAKDRFVDKSPLPLDDVRNLSFEARTLDEVCVEYQQLEYQTSREATESYYCQPLDERLDSGGSVMFECTAVDEEAKLIHGRLLTSDGEQYEPGTAAGLTGGSLSVSDGDFMVLTRLDFDQARPERTRSGAPESIRNSTTVTVSNLDEATGELTLAAPFTNGWPKRAEYSVTHRSWSTDRDAIDEDWSTYVSEGERYVVDPMFDKIVQNYAYEALQHAVDAPVRRWIRQLYRGQRDSVPIDSWDETTIEEYLEMIAGSEFNEPNAGQRRLITDTAHGIVTLQGPPGTGKTSLAVAPTVLGRVHSSMRTGDSFLGIVSAVSHSAVDEALESILELREECPPGESEQDVELVRVCSSSGQGIDDDRVTMVRYSEASDATLERLYETYFAPDRDPDDRAIFFGPPASLRSFLNTVYRKVDASPHSHITDAMEAGDSELFDMAVIDEASMMDLPLCFLVASFVTDGGQFTLVGDHRQMQPIQQHEWAEEDREPIEEHTPFLSALDFLRYLRGEDIDLEYVGRSPPELDDPEEALPIHRLEETYRLPPESAKLHTDLFYQQDDIELVSAGEQGHVPNVGGTIGEILDSQEARITLLVHEEGQSQKSNPVEQALIQECLNKLDPHTDNAEENDESSLSTGVVVPFRAQRRDLDQTQATVDTVERFQGGERDLMILSMTASERGYISQISDFLLEPNRFNVGASRMKRKLVVIASSGLFEESSDDVDSFEKQQAWISFFEGMGGIGGEDDSYRLSELVSDSVETEFLRGEGSAPDCTVRVYSGYDPQ